MIEERVQVVAVQGRYAMVRAVSRAGGCGACAKHGGCAVSALGRFLRPGGRTWKIQNTVAAAAGDEITLGLSDGVLLTAALLAYLLPMVSLLVGAAVAATTATSELQVALGAGAGLLAGIGFARWQSERLTARLAPQVTGRTSP
jgi:sigma-E factor negative regulatory protein RseC